MRKGNGVVLECSSVEGSSDMKSAMDISMIRLIFEKYEFGIVFVASKIMFIFIHFSEMSAGSSVKQIADYRVF